MRSQRATVPSTVLVLTLAFVSPVWSQSLHTNGDIETTAQLVSKVATGTAPLAVSSSTLVPSLNVDRVDGIEGTDLASLILAVQDQVTASSTARVPRTGQTDCYDAVGSVTPCGTGLGLGQDGDLQSGTGWPNPRFTDNGDGTVTDALTGLIWLQDASCLGAQTWADALAESNALFDGCTDCGGTDDDCGLSDGSLPGQWRLANLRELQSLVHYGVANPAVPDTAGTGKWSEGDPFSGVLPNDYWTSKTDSNPAFTDIAWVVRMSNGIDWLYAKSELHRVWPVRGGR
jgi:hypothetical protein